MRAEQLKGHLDMLLLAVLADGPKHGYAVIAELHRRSNQVLDLPDGTVYPALHRLLRAGLLASDWTTVNGRRRRVYHLTPNGRTALLEQQQTWQGFSGAVQSILKGVPWPKPS
jgi:PadR family transcriptional regulator, regulatory protein PadR